MSGENRLRREARKQRQGELYPELQFADAGEVLEIDRQRRKRGERPSSFGLAIEGTFARSRPPDFVPGRYSTAPDRPDYGENLLPLEPPRPALRRTPGEVGQQKLDEFRRLTGREPNDFERQQIELAGETEVGAARASQFAPGGGLRLAGGIAMVADELLGEPVRAQVKQGIPAMLNNPLDVVRQTRGVIEELRDPERVSGRDIALAAHLPDKDILPFDLSARDVVGGIQEAVFDVGIATGGATTAARGAGRAAARTAAREGVEEAAETSTRGLLRNADTPGAVEPVIPGQRPGLKRAVSGGAVQPATATRPAYAQPPPTAQALYGLEPFEVGLSRVDETMNSISETLGRAPVREEYATPVMRERARVQPRIAAQAERLGAVADSLVNDAFEFDKQGRIPALAGIDPTIPGAPTLADVAARLPDYELLLTPSQREALSTLQRELAPFNQMLDEVGVEVGSRPDVRQGGFYVPRGGAELEGLEPAVRFRGKGRPGGKKGFERTTTFDSQAAGIEAGYEYAPPGDALREYASAAGNRALDRHVLNYFTTLEEGGVRLARSAVDEMDPTLRARWQTFRASIAGARQTARRRTVRTVERMGEAERAARAETQAEGRAVRAEERMVARKATIEELDISGPAAVRDQLPTTAELRAEAARLRNRIRQTPAGAVSSAGENRRLVQRIGELEALADLRNAAERVGDDVDAMLARVEESADRAGNYVQTRLDPSLRAQARRDARLEGRTRGGVRRGADSLNADAPIEGPLAAVKAYEAALTRILESERFDLLREASTDDVIKAAERELRVLQRELTRTSTRARGASNRAGRAMAAEAETRQRLDSLLQQQDALRADYQRAVRKANETPRGRGRLDIAGAQAYTFPEALADAVNAVIDKQRGARGLSTEVRALNGILRGLTATGELSYLTIQGAIGAVADNPGYRRAMGRALAATFGEHGERITGAYIRNFDATRPTRGLPTSRVWASHGLQVGGVQTEFQVARAGALSPGRIPGAGRVARRADRGFGTFGDVLRLELADTLAEESRLVGRVLDNAELDRIVATANRNTGWSPQRAFGSLGEMVLYSPRFLQARIESVAQLVDIRDPRSMALARRTVGRYLAFAVGATITANYLNGEETDFTPVRQMSDGRWVKNGNFMRVRNVAGRDWSLLGPLDGLLGIAVAGGDATLALATAPQAGRGATVGRLARDARSALSAPLPGALVTLFTGRNAIGEETGVAELLLESVTPIGYRQGAEGIGQVRDAQTPEGKVAEVAGALTEAAVGARATQLSVTDRLSIAARDMGLGDNFYGLKPSERQQVLDANPDLAGRQGEEQLGREGATGQYEQAQQEYAAKQQAAADRHERGDISTAQLRDIWNEQSRALAVAGRLAFGERDTADDPKADPERRYYAAITRAERPDGTVDWDAVEAWRATLTDAENVRIDEETGVGGIPAVREMRAVRKELAEVGYFERDEIAWAAIQKQAEFLKEFDSYFDWRNVAQQQMEQALIERGYPPQLAEAEATDRVENRNQTSKAIIDRMTEARTTLDQRFMARHPDLAVRAVEWGYISTSRDEREALLELVR